MIAMPAASPLDIDDTLIALADPVRRNIVELLKVRARRAGDLAALLEISGPTMSKHLKVLRSSHLVDEERAVEDARVRVYRLRPERLEELRDWLSDVSTFWNDQLGAFKAAADAAARAAAGQAGVTDGSAKRPAGRSRDGKRR
jgi:DNA-binding transcriptional ArsR family regulator